MYHFRLLCVLLFSYNILSAQTGKLRARAWGIPFEGTPAANNTITDVPGVLVGYKTLIKDTAGKGIRTGVTVILPKGKTDAAYPAGWFCLNGDGEMTGTTVIEEYGLGYGPIGITNTNSVGVVRDAIGAWGVQHFSGSEMFDFSFGLPVVAETWDGIMSDINGLHVRKEHVWEALDNAHSGAIEEGNVGGGTGMAMFLFKGGIRVIVKMALIKYVLTMMVRTIIRSTYILFCPQAFHGVSNCSLNCLKTDSNECYYKCN